MMRRWYPIVGCVVAVMLVAGGYLAGNRHLLSPTPLAAADDCQTFPETGFQACGAFLTYWKTHGGLAQQGFPISSTFQEKSDTDGKTYTVQYFERAVFEAHPENQPPNDVLLSLLGSQKYKAKYPSGPPSGSPPPVVTPTAGTSATPSATNYGDAIGQVLMCVCTLHKDASFTLTLTDVKRTNTIGKSTATGIYAQVFFHATNTGKNPEFLANNGVVVIDAQGRKFSLSDVDQYDLQKQYGVKGPSEVIQPSLSADVLYVFEVAANSTGLKLGAGVWG